MPTSVAVSLPARASPLPALGGRSARRVPFGGGFVWPDRASRARLERRAGSLLRSMRVRDLYRALGFVRLGDYVAERLGVSLRGAQEMMRVDEALEALPLAASAFESGAITTGHLRLLTRVVSADDEAYWVALARRMKVKELGRAVATAREREAGDAAWAAGALGALEDPADPAGHDIFLPAWVSGWWRKTAALVRRLAGSALPAGEAFGMVVAEFVSGGLGAGWVPGTESGPGESAGLPSSASCPKAPSHDLPSEIAFAASAIDPAGLPRCAHLPGDACDSRGDAAPSAAEASLDARGVDRELRALFSERRRQDARLAAHLRLVGRDRGYIGEGFRSLEEFAAERFGLPARSLYRLLALHRAFERLPRLRRAFLTGRLTARQVVLVGGVATCVTLDAWMKRAEGVPLKRLEDESDFWQHLKECRPAVWSELDGLPLPAELSLAPGRAPQLPASALSPAAEPAAGGVAVSAASLLRAFEQDEAVTPLPGRMTVIKLWLDPAVREQWLAVLAEMRATRGKALEEWQALVLMLKEFWMVWDNEVTRRQRRENPILERDGWRCMVPWCRSVGTARLHVHHIVPRSQGGGDEPWNRVTLCVGCHLGLLHEGRIRVTGRAPDELLWELGLEPGREPFAIFRGDVKVKCGDD